MKVIKKENQGITTVLAFALLPLAGFATDVYIPSLPSMASNLHVTNTMVQLTLILFMVSSGVAQLFVGSLLDSFGRYRLGLVSLFIFTLSSFAIALSQQIYLIWAMRIVQGITVSMILVGKRAYFVDTFSGDKLKHYTSLFSIIWSVAPIAAPFVGGYLQDIFGWESNFYFLGAITLIVLVFELIYGGESLKNFQPFEAKSILRVYESMIKTTDFTFGLTVIALAYSNVAVYGLVSPFIIEHVYHYSPVVTGYCSLLSGAAILTGSVISKLMITRPLVSKVSVAVTIQMILALCMFATFMYISNMVLFIGFMFLIHMLGGYIFNNIYAFCLGRFSKNAGIASGITGGTLYVLSSILSYGIVSLIAVKNPFLLSIVYLSFIFMSCIFVFLFNRARAAYARTAIVNV